MKYVYLLFLSVMVGGCSNTQDPETSNPNPIDCVERSLLPYLSVEMCLPLDADIVELDGDHSNVNLKITVPSIGDIFVDELPRVDFEKGVIAKKRKEVESSVDADLIVDSGDEFIVEERGSTFVVHVFKEHYGWPYYLRSSVVGTKEKADQLKELMLSFSFT